MSYLQELDTIACNSQDHDGHIARTILNAVTAAKEGSLAQGQAKLIISNILKQYDRAGNVTNKQALFQLAHNVKKTNLLFL